MGRDTEGELRWSLPRDCLRSASCPGCSWDERVNWPMNLYVNSIFTVSGKLAVARWDEKCQSVFYDVTTRILFLHSACFKKATYTGRCNVTMAWSRFGLFWQFWNRRCE